MDSYEVGYFLGLVNFFIKIEFSLSIVSLHIR